MNNRSTPSLSGDVEKPIKRDRHCRVGGESVDSGRGKFSTSLELNEDSDTGIGKLAGIARHARPKGPMETIDHAIVTAECGIVGDYRGAMKGRPYKRQVTLIERCDWEAALAEVSRSIPWQERRANLLLDDFDLPQMKGARLRIGKDVVLEVTIETDPCNRMENVAPGLRAALTPDWRGGACAMVVAGGTIRIGDEIRMENT